MLNRALFDFAKILVNTSSAKNRNKNNDDPNNKGSLGSNKSRSGILLKSTPNICFLKFYWDIFELIRFCKAPTLLHFSTSKPLNLTP